MTGWTPNELTALADASSYANSQPITPAPLTTIVAVGTSGISLSRRARATPCLSTRSDTCSRA